MTKTVLVLLIFFSVDLIVLAAAAPPNPLPNSPNEESQGLETSAIRPNMPASRILNNAVRGGIEAQNDKSPSSSGDFWDGLSLSADYTRTSFDDDSVDSSGHVEEKLISMTGILAENTTLTLGFSNIFYRYGKPSPAYEITANGVDAAIHHNLTDNYGVGVFGFFQDVDIENENGNSFTGGVGGMFTTFHDIGFANLSTITSVSWTDYDTGQDSILILMGDLSRDLTDWFGAGVNVSWIDSLRSDNDLDSNYWTVGADLRFYLEKFTITVGYEKTLGYSDYSDNTLNIGLVYTF